MKVLTTFALLLIFTAVGAAQENNSEEDKPQPATVESTVLQSGSPRGEVPPEVPGERGVPKNSVQVGVNAFGSYDTLGNTGGSGDATIGEGMVFRLNNQTRNGRT